MLKRRSVVSAMAFATLFISSVEVAYAQPSLPLEVELVVVPPTEAELRAAIPGETEPTWPTLLEMSDRSSMLSWDMLMVSVMMKKVEQARTPKGARSVAADMAKEKYGWGKYQFSCLNTLWTKESNWNYRARNKRTGAHGIPQALPATKMEVTGTDWRTNPVTQIQWGLHYIDVRYETPCKALAKFKRSRYY
ncbi:MAG: hypothetical protein RL421_266 [Actinomycetota bacterium]|jgi:hypothetical protein